MHNLVRLHRDAFDGTRVFTSSLSTLMTHISRTRMVGAVQYKRKPTIRLHVLQTKVNKLR